MNPHYEDAGLRLWHGPNMDILPTFADASFDSIVTDPPYELGFMGKGWDSSGIAYDVDVWRECLRVLKPGGHLLAFGGSRTWHRMAVAIEDAGFEMRDSIAWLYGSGFPKSMNVAAAIDKIRDDTDDVRAVCRWLRARIDEHPTLTVKEIAASFGFHPRMVEHWAARDTDSQPSMPTLEQWDILRDALGFSSEMDAEVYRLNTRKGEPGEAWAGRDIVGAVEESKDRTNYALTSRDGLKRGSTKNPVAEEWQGWGTALKPAFEPIVVARKPLGGQINVRARVEHELRARGVVGDISWIRSSASDAVSTSRTTTSGSTAAQRTAATFARSASDSVTQPTASETGKCIASRVEGGEKLTPSTHAQRADDASENCARQSSRPTEGNAPAAASSKTSSSRSTTSMAEAQPTGGPCTARSTHSSGDSDTQADTESFAGTATGLTGSQAHVLIRRSPDGAFLWPTDLPESVSVGSTVAANVLAHGTGALNIDATRTAGEVPQVMQGGRKINGGKYNDSGAGEVRRTVSEPNKGGRWPTNVLLDETQADALDAQTGVLTSGKLAAHHARAPKDAGILGAYGSAEGERGYGDSGGASRFFPTFRYEAKAPTSERPNVEGAVHATVKPLALIRWLVRLVTRPGGRVLDLYAGSGTTGEAALLEGMEVDLIELEEAHLPLILARVRKPLQPSMFGDWEDVS